MKRPIHEAPRRDRPNVLRHMWQVRRRTLLHQTVTAIFRDARSYGLFYCICLAAFLGSIFLLAWATL